MRDFFIRSQKVRWIGFTILLSTYVLFNQDDVAYVLLRVFIMCVVGYYLERMITASYAEVCYCGNTL